MMSSCKQNLLLNPLNEEGKPGVPGALGWEKEQSQLEPRRQKPLKHRPGG